MARGAKPSTLSKDYIESDTAARLSSAGYGTQGERLSAFGLSDSGYRDYLDTVTAKMLGATRGEFLSKKNFNSVSAQKISRRKNCRDFWKIP